MECLCELFPYIRQTVCLIGVFVTDNSCNIGIAALFAMSLLHLLWSSEERIKIQIQGQNQESVKTGANISLTGTVQFHHSVNYVKWQKYHNGQFVDINIHKSKYQGTTNNLQSPKLVINDVDQDDEIDYRLEVQRTNSTEYSNVQKIQILPSPAIGPPEVILSDLPESLYNECIQIKASIRSFPKYNRVIWFKGEEQIDVAQPKYVGSFHGADFSVLCINNITKKDESEYKIKITNDLGNVERISNPLKVYGAKPMVILSMPSPLVTYGGTITLEAEITSCPKPLSIEWTKDNKIIDADDQKFVIDNSYTCNSKLSIRSLDFDDSGKYTVSVNNALGSTHDETDIVVKATNFIFVAGPVVVMPSTTIKFRTVYPPSINSDNGEWCVTRDRVTTTLDFKARGYSIKTGSNQPITQKIEIKGASGKGGAYQLSVGNTKSNSINVFVDDSRKYVTENEGNCLRFFALQAVGKIAMRTIVDRMPDTFEIKWDTFDKYCKQRKGKFLELLPKCKPKSSSDLDVSTMYAMIRNASNIAHPTNGWGKPPGKNDTNIADDIERLRKYRNKICHENSSEMTTDDFNKFALDFISAIQRLTANDEQVIKQICEILNVLCCRGKEMDKMMEDLTKFKESAVKLEDILKELKDENTPSPKSEMSEDKQAIYLTGNTEVFNGEKAMLIAFIDQKISTSSKVCWHKTDCNGKMMTIDINEGKYTGSTTKFPSPELHIHFVRNEDEGTYRIVINTQRTIVYNSIELKVKKRGCDKEKHLDIDNDSKEIGIHEVYHDPNIILLHNNTIARKKNGELHHGICFTNRSLEVGEKIYVRIAETYASSSSSVDFGFTNTDPARNIVPLTCRKPLIGDPGCKVIKPLQILLAIDNVICLSINKDATVSCSINEKLKYTEKLSYVSVKDPIWLVIDLNGHTRAIEISHKKPSIMSCDSFLIEFMQ